MIFGDTMDSAYDYLNEQRIGVKFEKIRVYLEMIHLKTSQLKATLHI